MIYSLDTSILIFLLQGEDSVVKEFISKSETNCVSISPIAYLEVLQGYEYKRATQKIKLLESFLSESYKPNINDFEVMKLTGRLYGERRRKGLPHDDNDLLIASWSILANAILVTDNTKHFKDIDGLQIENWKH